MAENYNCVASEVQAYVGPRRTAILGGETPMPSTKTKVVPKAEKNLCHICGKECDSYICGACADKVRAEALNKKKWEDRGKA